MLYPEGGEGLMKEAGLRTVEHTHHRVYHLLLQQLVQSRLGTTGDRPLRILEVGGGNGFLTSLIAPGLKDQSVEYWFTDLGKSFVLAVERQASQRFRNATSVADARR